jgi:hypothetical protein
MSHELYNNGWLVLLADSRMGAVSMEHGES